MSSASADGGPEGPGDAEHWPLGSATGSPADADERCDSGGGVMKDKEGGRGAAHREEAPRS